MPYDFSKSYSLSGTGLTGSTIIDGKNSTIIGYGKNNNLSSGYLIKTGNDYSTVLNGKYSFIGSGSGSTIFPTSVPDNTRCNILGQKLTLELLPEKEKQPFLTGYGF